MERCTLTRLLLHSTIGRSSERFVHALGTADRDKSVIELCRFTGPVEVAGDAHAHHFAVIGERLPMVLGHRGARQVAGEQLKIDGRRQTYARRTVDSPVAVAVSAAAAVTRWTRAVWRWCRRSRWTARMRWFVDERLDEPFRSGHLQQLDKRAPDRVHRLDDQQSAVAVATVAFSSSQHRVVLSD